DAVNFISHGIAKGGEPDEEPDQESLADSESPEDKNKSALARFAVNLNTRPVRTISDAVHEGMLDAELLTEVMLPHNSGIKLLLGPSSPELADAITPDMVSQTIKTVRKHFKAVVVDTASVLTDRTLNVLDSANQIVLLCAPELTAIKSTKLFIELAQQLEWGPERIEVVMNRSTLPGGIPVDKVGKALGLKRISQIPDDPRVHTAVSKGVPVNHEDSNAPAARAIRQMAAALLKKVQKQSETPLVKEAA
ncbi:MAG: hypothetical protein R3264_02885, partial [Anaerolineae bacterium]|nr:hypothetical protein [Anaerolineae bacterium]